MTQHVEATRLSRETGGRSMPPRWKASVLAFVGLYPLVTGASVLAASLATGLPVALRTVVVIAVVVPTMSYLVTPALHRIARGWLHPECIRGPRRSPTIRK